MTFTQENKMTIEEYEEHQLTCEGCHEYDNGYLYRVPDEKLIENATSTFLSYFLVTQLAKAYSVCSHRVRIAIPNEPKFFYPDVMITQEAETEHNEYVQFEPELLAEITSDETYEHNTVYKLNEYRKIPSLKYYLIIHFEKHFTLLHYRDVNNEWQMETYNAENAVIDLPLINVQLPMGKIYRNYKETKNSITATQENKMPNTEVKNSTIAKQEETMTIEEYEEHQLTCEGRHEYDNGHLYRVPDEMDIENLTASEFVYLFFQTLRRQGYHIYAHAVRIAIPNEPKFYYPDVFITKEADTEHNEYVKYEPELIVEVTSSKTLTRNTVYKFIDYTKIPSLKYYLVVHFIKHITWCYYKDEKGEWTFDAYTLPDEIVPLPLLQIQIPLKEIYQ